MTQRRFIAVGVDGSHDGLRGVEYAVKQAKSQNRGIRLVHAYHVIAGLNPMLPLDGVEELREFGRKALDDAERHALEVDPDARVDHLLVMGTPARALVSAGKFASMIVLGRRSIHGIERLLSGSTSSAVAAKATVPVVSVAEQLSELKQGQGIVVGADGSPAGRDAVAFAFQQASQRGVPLTVVRVWEIPMRWDAEFPLLDGELEEWEEQAKLALAEDLAGWTENYPDVTVSRVVKRSVSPAAVLVGHGHDASGLIIGARGFGGLPGLDLGWTARNILAHATCPVTIVHKGDLARVDDSRLVPSAAASAH